MTYAIFVDGIALDRSSPKLTKIEKQIEDLGCKVKVILGGPYAFYGSGSLVVCPDRTSAELASDILAEETQDKVVLMKVLRENFSKTLYPLNP